MRAKSLAPAVTSHFSCDPSHTNFLVYELIFYFHLISLLQKRHRLVERKAMCAKLGAACDIRHQEKGGGGVSVACTVDGLSAKCMPGIRRRAGHTMRGTPLIRGCWQRLQSGASASLPGPGLSGLRTWTHSTTFLVGDKMPYFLALAA